MTRKYNNTKNERNKNNKLQPKFSAESKVETQTDRQKERETCRSKDFQSFAALQSPIIKPK